MARDTCFECGKYLVYAKGGGTKHKIWIDPLGNEHKLHKFCYSAGSYNSKPITAQETKHK